MVQRCVTKPSGLGRKVGFAGVASWLSYWATLTLSVPALAQVEPAPPPEEGTSVSPAPEGPSGGAAEPAADPATEPTADPATDPAPEDLSEAEFPESEIAQGEIAEVVVTSFRRSLGAALQRKQRSTGQVDAIVADDIADFPDLNLAESLQRIPGVAITRFNGEGNQITVRGLSGLYTRVRVNGMETRAGVGANNTRNFDFNLFASELFNSVVVHKTASADLDEGSLGAVVDLNTARPFNYKEGWTLVAGGTGAYNDLSNTVRPRLTGLVAYRDPGGLWGATASAAYTRARLDVASRDTVRWQKSAFNTVRGVVCADNPGDVGCAEVADAFHPRIPRYGENVTSGERLGLTGGVQIRPAESTEIRLDGLYATYDTQTDLRWLEVLFRGNERTQNIINYTLRPFPSRFEQGNNTLVAADVDNAWVRTETLQTITQSKFHQFTLGIDQRFTDSFRASALAGTSRAKSRVPHDTTLSYDALGYNGYGYDYSNDRYPVLAFNGPDVTDPTLFTLSELRDRVQRTTSGFDTLKLDTHWELLDALTLSAGVNYKRATLDNKQWQRDGTVCGFALYDCDVDDDGTNDVSGAPGQAALSDQVEFPGRVGAGSNTRWAAASVDRWTKELGYYDVPLSDDQDSIYRVTEKNLGYFAQLRGEVMLGASNLRLQYDGGVRYVETRQTSAGYNSGVFITIARPTYRDWLPSGNAALWLTEELVVRLAAARVMARPALGDLSPGGTVDSFNYTINFQNPNLNPTRATALDAATEWYFADGALLSLAVFWKDIESFPIRQARRGTFGSTGLPRSVIQPTSPADVSGDAAEGTCGEPGGCWDISELSNGPGSTLKGFEVGLQAPFNALYDRLPPVLRSMGIVANYTFVDSVADYEFLTNPVTERLLGLSNGSYNATLYYDDSRFSARVSAAYRSDFLLEGPNRTGNLWEYAEANTRIDAASSFDVTQNLKLSLEALNLTDTPFATQVDVDARRRVAYNKTGRTFLLGARLSY
jgi:iron complex outermembrane recepter protein